VSDSSVYYPQRPVDPKHFAGREKIIGEVKKTIKSAEQGSPENSAISGIRGIGKTSLVFKLRELVPNTCFLAYFVPSKEIGTKEFVVSLLQKMDLQYMTGLGKYKKLLEKVKSFPGKVESFSVSEIAISLRNQEKTPEIAFMQAISQYIKRGFKAIILQIDEADLLTNEVLAMLRNCIQELQSPTYNCYVAVLVSGRENLLKRLTGKLSPISRFFSTHSYELQSLDKQEVSDALSLPVKDRGIKWKDDAKEFVFSMSRGYPFIVQLFGKYALEYCNGRVVTRDDVISANSDVLSEVGNWYESGWNNDPSPKEIQVLLAVCSLKGRVSFTQVKTKTQLNDAGELLKRLKNKGCLEKDEGSNEYFLPHPMVIDYLKIRFKGKKSQ